MRFGLNTFLLNSGFTTADLPLVDQFKAYGAEVFEPAIVEPSEVDAQALRAALDAAGMQGVVICGAFPEHRDLRGTPEQQAASIKYIGELIDLAKAVGSKVVCGPMYSSVGRCNAHTPAEREAQLELVANNLRPLCAQAEEAGVVLAFEPLNRFETDFINTLEQAAELIRRVGSPALKIHADTFHMSIEEADSAQAIRDAGDLIGHFHASASNRGIPGRDQIDWKEILSALADIGYQGDIVVESFSMDNTVIARAASIWRPLFDSPEQLSVESLTFLRKTWSDIASA